MHCCRFRHVLSLRAAQLSALLTIAGACGVRHGHAEARPTASHVGGATYSSIESRLLHGLLVQFSLQVDDTMRPRLVIARARLRNEGRDTARVEATGCAITVRGYSEPPSQMSVQWTPEPGCRLILRTIPVPPGESRTIEEDFNLVLPTGPPPPGPYTLTAMLTLRTPSLVSSEVAVTKLIIR